jgi:GAF domain-containing protein
MGTGLEEAVRPDNRISTMYDFSASPDASPEETYRALAEAARSITEGEPDRVANMANVAALIWAFVPNLNWAGFYRMGEAVGGGNELILGPFFGRPACIRIALGNGVCGAAAQDAKTQLVDDVHAFPGHIACDGETRSELVVPVIRNGAVIAVIDCDSPKRARFSQTDAEGIEQLSRIIADRI